MVYSAVFSLVAIIDGKDMHRNLFAWANATIAKNVVSDNSDKNFTVSETDGTPVKSKMVTFDCTEKGNGIYIKNWGKLTVGQTYTISLYIKKESEDYLRFSSYPFLEDQDFSNWKAITVHGTSIWSRLNYSFVAKTESPTIVIYPDAATKNITVCGIKVEEGDEMTDFCLNEQDLKGEQGEKGDSPYLIHTSTDAIIWNQKGNVTVDENGKAVDKSYWPQMEIQAYLEKDGKNIGGSLSFSKVSGNYSMSVQYDSNLKVYVCKLSSPQKNDGESELWTNGVLRVSYNLGNGSYLSKDIPIALNSLGTWKMSVINDTMTATSKKVEADTNGKIETLQTQITQTAESLSAKVSVVQKDTSKNMLDMSSIGERIAKHQVLNVYGNINLVKDKIYTVTWKGRMTEGTYYQKICVYNSSGSPAEYHNSTDSGVICHSTTAKIYSFTFKAQNTLQYTIGYYICNEGGDQNVSNISNISDGSAIEWMRIDEGDMRNSDGSPLLTDWSPSDNDLEAVNLLPDYKLKNSLYSSYSEIGLGIRELVNGQTGSVISSVMTLGEEGDVPYIRFKRNSGYTTSTGALLDGLRWYIPFRGAGYYTISASFKNMRGNTHSDGNGIILEFHACNEAKTRLKDYSVRLYEDSQNYGWVPSSQSFYINETESSQDVKWIEVRLYMTRNGDMAASRLCVSKCSHPTLWNAQELSEARKAESTQLATGIDIYNKKIVATADDFEWKDNSGNTIARFDKDSGATFSGNIAAKTLTTKNARIDEDGKLTARDVELSGSVSTEDASTGLKTTLSGGGMTVTNNGAVVTTHTGQKFDSIDQLIPGASFDVSSMYDTSRHSLNTDSIKTGSTSKSKVIFTIKAQATGMLQIAFDKMNVGVDADNGTTLNSVVSAEATVTFGDREIRRSGAEYGYITGDGTYYYGTEAQTCNVSIIKGQSYDIVLTVRLQVNVLSLLSQSIYAYADMKINSISFVSNAYNAIFFGNGIMLSQSNQDYIAMMMNPVGRLLFQMISGQTHGLTLDSTGLYALAAEKLWCKQPITVAYLRITCSPLSIDKKSMPGAYDFATGTRNITDKTGAIYHSNQTGEVNILFPEEWREALHLGTNGFCQITAIKQNQNKTDYTEHGTVINLSDTGFQLNFGNQNGRVDDATLDVEIKMI